MAKQLAVDVGTEKRKKIVLSIESKVKILKKLHEGSSIKSLCTTYNIGKSTIYDIKKNKEELLKFYRDADQPNLLAKRKTMQYGKNEDVDKVLMEWIRQKRSESFPLNRNYHGPSKKVS